ncbi:MAG: glycosyltransferase, partial [Planctomycetia bacterium]|nr:glycosyltransferase [Planctomycetia bacterium]
MSDTAARPRVTIVVPVFNEEAVLPELLRRLSAVFERENSCVWRAVLVDDGSRD